MQKRPALTLAQMAPPDQTQDRCPCRRYHPFPFSRHRLRLLHVLYRCKMNEVPSNGILTQDHAAEAMCGSEGLDGGTSKEQ